MIMASHLQVMLRISPIDYLGHVRQGRYSPFCRAILCAVLVLIKVEFIKVDFTTSQPLYVEKDKKIRHLRSILYILLLTPQMKIHATWVHEKSCHTRVNKTVVRHMWQTNMILFLDQIWDKESSSGLIQNLKGNI